jgi:hypothetical protein
MNVTLWQCSTHGIQPYYTNERNKDSKLCTLCGGLLDAVEPSRRQEEISKMVKQEAADVDECC